MKKIFALLMVCAFAATFTACSNKAKEEAAAKAKKAADSIAAVAKADSIKMVEAAAAMAKHKADSTMKADSVAKAATTKMKK